MKEVKIDRRKPFDLGHLATLGPMVYSIHYQHRTSLAVEKFTLDDVVILRDPIPGEEDVDPWQIPLQERYERLDKLGLIPADAMLFQALWDRRRELPERFRPPEKGKVFELRFLGTLFFAPQNPFPLHPFNPEDKCPTILKMTYDDERKRWERGMTGSVFPDWYRPLVLVKKNQDVQVPITVSGKGRIYRPACIADPVSPDLKL